MIKVYFSILLMTTVVGLVLVFVVGTLASVLDIAEPIGPPLPSIIVLRDGEVPDLAAELIYYKSSGYTISTSSGGIRGPLVILELEQ